MLAEVQPVPDGWGRVRLADVARERQQRGNSAVDAEVFSVTKYDGFVRSLDYFERQVFSRDTGNYKVVRRDDLAYATIHLDEGSLGILREAESGLISPMYTVFEVDRIRVDPNFLFSLMKLPTMVARYRRIGEGTVHRRKSISFGRLGRLEFVIPAVVEQRAIMAVLDAIDDAIGHAEAVIAATERLREALLHELLTRGVPGWHSEWKEVPGVGTVPTSWDVVRLEDVLETTTYGTNAALERAGAIPVLRMSNLQNGEIDLSEVRYGDLAESEVSDLNLVPGDILFNRTNSLDLVGKVAVVRELPKRMSFASYLIRLRVRDERADAFWLAALLASDGFQSRIRRLATPAVSQANINPTSLKSLTVPLPSLPEQQEANQLLDALRTRAVAEGVERSVLVTAKAAVSDALLTGRVRVPVGEEVST